jgi:hypothetical protein
MVELALRDLLYVGCNITLEGATTGRNGGEVARANQKFVIVFEEEGPF